ncbi:MAG: hypothetical protein GF331_25665 [Chitinivibrionales bacterium]|nr:hypothetical protein [Chitinivibrionales bacterium]
MVSLTGDNELTWQAKAIRGGSYVARLYAGAADGWCQEVDIRRIAPWMLRR